MYTVRYEESEERKTSPSCDNGLKEVTAICAKCAAPDHVVLFVRFPASYLQCYVRCRLIASNSLSLFFLFFFFPPPVVPSRDLCFSSLSCSVPPSFVASSMLARDCSFLSSVSRQAQPYLRLSMVCCSSIIDKIYFMCDAIVYKRWRRTPAVREINGAYMLRWPLFWGW